MRSADHITGALISLHWLRASQWIEYKVAVPINEVLHGSAPRCLGPLVPVADLLRRRTVVHWYALPAPIACWLLTPSVRFPTTGSRIFPVAAPRIWNALREETTSAQSLTSFHQHLKTWLFRQSDPDLIIWSVVHRLSNCFTTITVQPWSSYATKGFMIEWVSSFLTAHQHIKGHSVP